jgi:membrane protein DedA with SNARE-associated domain
VTDEADDQKTADPPSGSTPSVPVDADGPVSTDPDGQQPPDPTDPRGQAPRHFLRLHAWLDQRFSPKARRRLGVVVGFGAALGGTLIAAGLAKRLGLDIPWAAWIGLFLANWIGNGGILVPIPGLRLVGMAMAAYQGAYGSTILVGLVAGFAMALGQTSFYLTAASGSRHLQDPAKKEKKPREGRLAQTMRKAMEVTADFVDRHGIPTIFTLSTFPNPLTTFATITAGSMGMGFREFLIANFAGHVLLGLILALFGQRLLGV